MTSIPIAAGSAMWFFTRSSGAVSLVLLTLSVVLGIVNVQRWRTPAWPRFVTDGLHRNVSLLVLVFVLAHVATAVADTFAPVSLLDAVVPFAGTYRPLWLGLGAVSFDLLLALALTSMLRSAVGVRTWRVVHWAAYACWPVALVHGLGTGSDTTHGWMLALAVACIATVWIALWIRVGASRPRQPSRKPLAFATIIAAPLAISVWMPMGPLGAHWAKRSGTPAALLPRGSAAAGKPAAQNAQAVSFHRSFSAPVTGTIGQSPAGADLVTLDMPMRVQDSTQADLDIRIVGRPMADGGVSMTDSRVTLGPARAPRLYRGRITSLSGTNVVAVLSGPHRPPIRVQALLRIDSQTSTVAGDVKAQPTQVQG